ncbi:MAG: hypothetical protein COU85_00005, partial [Candidatus Portnoybacteria bacterium CG10_big_fil_rev_8_21_14_0_10_44_7]
MLTWAAFLILGALAGRFWAAAWAYNATKTHPGFTENVAQIYNQTGQPPLTAAEIGWLKKGSVEEDKNYWRCLNHFYDPGSGRGLYGNYAAK